MTFILAISVMQVKFLIFWTEDNICVISECWNFFNGEFKKFENKQKKSLQFNKYTVLI